MGFWKVSAKCWTGEPDPLCCVCSSKSVLLNVNEYPRATLTWKSIILPSWNPFGVFFHIKFADHKSPWIITSFIPGDKHCMKFHFQKNALLSTLRLGPPKVCEIIMFLLLDAWQLLLRAPVACTPGFLSCYQAFRPSRVGELLPDLPGKMKTRHSYRLANPGQKCLHVASPTFCRSRMWDASHERDWLTPPFIFCLYSS